MGKRPASEYSSHQTKIRNRYRLSLAVSEDDGAWNKHTKHHWSRELNGRRLDYWPSTNRFRFDGKMYREGYSGRRGTEPYDGDVYKFIEEQ